MGQTNAEIAVRLGISVNTVRYHVSNLLSKAGVAERSELAGWKPGRVAGTSEHGTAARRSEDERGGQWRRPGWLLLTAALGSVGAVVVAGVLWLAWAPSEGEGEEEQPPAGYRVYEAEELEALGMVDVGPVLQLAGEDEPVRGVALREAAAAAVVREGTQVVLRRDPCCSWGSGASYMLFLADVAAGSEALSRLGPLSVAVFTDPGTLLEFEPGGKPSATTSRDVPILGIRVWKAGAGYIYGDGRREALPSALDARGHLWVNPEPVDVNVPIDGSTGRTINLAEADLMATDWPGLPVDYPEQGSNRCGQYTEKGQCVTSLYSRMTAPVAGRLTCAAGTSSYRLETAEFVLVFSRAMDAERYPRCTGEGIARDVAAGEEFDSGAWWVVTAETLDGEPLDVARSYSGMLYVGRGMMPDQSCPCVGSN
jgi:hypothetical protein